jgi:hypothetical protein
MKIALHSILQAGCGHIWNEMLLSGKISGGALIIEDSIAAPLISKCNGEISLIDESDYGRQIMIPSLPQKFKSNIQEIPHEEWPLAIRLFISASRKPSDTGLGDIVERIIGPIGGEEFKRWYKTIFGKDCGCGQRKQWLNGRYPLKSN